MILNGILTEHSQQKQLFDERPGNPKLMAAVDKINARFGAGSVFLASNGTGQQWQMLSTMRSKCSMTPVEGVADGEYVFSLLSLGKK